MTDESKSRIKGIVLSKEKVKAAETASVIIEDAKAGAQKIIEEARRKSAKILSDAEQTGFNEGFKKLASTLSELNRNQKEIQDKYRSDLTALAVRIAEKIIHTELSLPNEVIINIVTDMLAKNRRDRHLTIHLSKEDYDTHSTRFLQLKDQNSTFRDITFCTNDQLSRGDCLLEMPDGLIDAKISLQLERIERMLKGIPWK